MSSALKAILIFLGIYGFLLLVTVGILFFGIIEQHTGAFDIGADAFKTALGAVIGALSTAFAAIVTELSGRRDTGAAAGGANAEGARGEIAGEARGEMAGEAAGARE